MSNIPKTIREACYRDSISSISKEEFQRLFINKRLEHCAGKIYDIFFTGYELGNSFVIVEELYWNLVCILDDAARMASLMLDLRNIDWLRENYDIMNIDDMDLMTEALDKVFVEKIAQVTLAVDKLYFTEAMDPESKTAVDRISKEVSMLKTQHEIEFNDNGKIHPLDMEIYRFHLRGAKETLEHAFDSSRENYINRVLMEIVGMDIRLDNEVYREIYECLEHLGLIPEDVLRSHRNTSSKYVKENYIKAKYKRLGFPRKSIIQ